MENADCDKYSIGQYQDILVDMCYQFASPVDNPCGLATGGLSALEDAFELLGWDNPHLTPELQCQYEGCAKTATCGTPSQHGYLRVCGWHFDILQAAVRL